jgi:hypothetical protein
MAVPCTPSILCMPSRRARAFLAAQATVTALVVAYLFGCQPPSATAATPLVVHVAPTGDDQGTGATPTTPVATIARAQQIVRHTRHGAPAHIHLAAGTYTAPTTWGQPDTTISGPTTGRAILDGNGQGGFGLVIRADHVTVEHLTIREWLNGTQVSQAAGVTFRDVTWYRIGSAYAGTGAPGYGALHLSDADHVEVTDSAWGDVVNLGDTPARGLIHAVYATNDSDDLTVSDSRTSRVSGDPFRVRDGSDNARVATTTCTRSGRRALFSEWRLSTEDPSVGGRMVPAGSPTLWDGRAAA